MKERVKDSSMKIGAEAFILSVVIILLLMITAGVLTLLLPSGSYDRVVADGRTMIVPGSFRNVEKPAYPFWRWFTAPVEVFAGPDALALITLSLFLLCIGGAFTILEQAGVIRYLLALVVRRFSGRKYLLMGILIFSFMFLSSFLGIYEAMVPLVVFIVPLAVSLGWDSLVGLGMSFLPLAFGFAAAVTNPFTIGFAQRIAELPLFSGAWYRIIFFIIVYACVLLYVRAYARRVERDPARSLSKDHDHRVETVDSREEGNAGIRKASVWFLGVMVVTLSFILVTSRIPSLSAVAFPVMALLFLVGGIGAGMFSGMGGKGVGGSFLHGAGNLAPGILLVAMAYSVKHIIDMGRITDTILHAAALRIAGAPTMGAAFLVYLLTLIMNFFIGSASAKAFLMMPILTPLADLVGITRQTAVLAFDFGDGFSNVFFPSNPLLLIALSFTVVSYPTWIRFTWKLQALMLGLTSLFLAVAVFIGFGPF
ncbi:MAG: YfcC family protein [Spirochaetales bacterium]|nr:YfcC family protein [Spirochaetales bacterium]